MDINTIVNTNNGHTSEFALRKWEWKQGTQGREGEYHHLVKFNVNKTSNE